MFGFFNQSTSDTDNITTESKCNKFLQSKQWRDFRANMIKALNEENHFEGTQKEYLRNASSYSETMFGFRCLRDEACKNGWDAVLNTNEFFDAHIIQLKVRKPIDVLPPLPKCVCTETECKVVSV